MGQDIITGENLIFIALLGFACGVLVAACIGFYLLWRTNKANAAQTAAHKEGFAQQERQLLNQLHELEKQLVRERALLGEQQGVAAKIVEKEAQLSTAQRDNATVQRDNAMLKAQLDAEQKHFHSQLATLKEAKESLTKEFENIANKIFEHKQQQFKQSSQSTLDLTLNPLKEQIREFKKQVEDAYHKENAERNKLIGQIAELQKQAQQIGQDAVNLATALKGNNKAQGNWGEVILERLLEESGLHKGREYETQVSLKDEQGNRRNPDVIVRLPDNKDIVIDAKVSLVHYETYCNTQDDTERMLALKSHLASLRAHIDSLSKKNYEGLASIRTLDFVFIFIPIESAFMLAMEHDQGLFQYAYEKHIILVSPTTLLATLRTVESIWRYEKQNKNAEAIAAMAGGLHDQFALVMGSLQDLGGHIQRTQAAYDRTTQQIQTGRGNLYKRIQDLEKLGAKTKRRLQKQQEDGLPDTSSRLIESDAELALDDSGDEIESALESSTAGE